MSPDSNIDRNMPILVVDDLPAMRRITKHCLKQLGFENVIEAEDCSQALQILQTSQVEFVISDWSLPDLPASVMVESLRHASAGATPPVLMVAPEAQRTAALKSMPESGAELLIKPFTADLLQLKIEQALNRSE